MPALSRKAGIRYRRQHAVRMIVAGFRSGRIPGQICLQTGGDCRAQKLTHASSRVADFCDTNISFFNGFCRSSRAMPIGSFCQIGP